MFWNLDGWKELDGDTTSKAVESANQFFTNQIADWYPLTPASDSSSTASGHTGDIRLIVTKARCRHLPFYEPDWWLYELTCDIKSLRSIPIFDEELSGYADYARIFAIKGPSGSGVACWFLLNWTSLPIYEVNQGGALHLAKQTSGAQEIDLAREYLIFFCSFLVGERANDRSFSPFLLPASSEDLPVDEFTSQDLESYPIPQENEGPDPFDLGESSRKLAAAHSHPEHTHPEQTSDESIKTDVERIFETFGDNPKQKGGTALNFDAIVWYQGTLFESTFEIMADAEIGDDIGNRSTRRGRVHMVSDKPLLSGIVLPIPRLEVRQLPNNVRILCQQTRRRNITAQKLFHYIGLSKDEQIDSSETTEWRRSRPRLRITDSGEIMFPPCVPVAITLEDVEFVGAVVLDDCVFERSLIFRNCRFRQNLSARNATIKGAFVLEGTRIEGALSKSAPKSKRPEAALVLESLRSERGIFADDLLVNGPILARWMQLGGPLLARGLRVYSHLEHTSPQDKAVDLSNTVIAGQLDLGPHIIKNPEEPGNRRRTRLDWHCNLTNLQARMVDLSGTYINRSLDLTGCRMDGGLVCSVSWDTERKGGWRTIINSNLVLDRGKTGLIWIEGIRINGDLSLIEHELNGSCFGRLAGRYRTKVNRHLVVSGTKIRGDMDLSGSQIGGELQFITGKCGRLKADASWWRDPTDNVLRPKLCATAAGGLLFQDVTIDGLLSLTGVMLGTNSGVSQYAGDGIRTNNLQVGGSVQFWSPTRAHDLKNLAKDRKPERAHNAWDADVQQAIESVTADIQGEVVLQGMHVGGDLDLGRVRAHSSIILDSAKVKGSLRTCAPDLPSTTKFSCTAEEFRMTGAHIEGNVELHQLETTGGDLAARSICVGGDLDLGYIKAHQSIILDFAEIEGSLATQHSCSVDTFTMTGAKIAGNVDLCNLEIRNGNLAAREVNVEGTVRLAKETPQPGTGKPHLEVHGSLDLQGLTAAQLVLTSHNAENPNDPEASAICLSRAKIGQLSLRGFQRSGKTYEFPRRIDLRAIEVGDWDFDPVKEAIPLLKATGHHSFDGRNYVDFEARLARIGQIKLANKVYRILAWQKASHTSGLTGLREKLGYSLQWLFSANKTSVGRMFCWLLIVTLPVFILLSDWRNVEFNNREKRDTYVLQNDWNVIKAAGLTLSYAIPIFRASGDEPIRARLVGESCLPWKDGYAPGREPAWEGEPRCPSILWGSPHDIAQGVSIIQIVLWLFIAGNLPAAIRRR